MNALLRMMTAATVVAIATAASASAQTLASFKGTERGRLVYTGFRLDEAQKLSVSSTGFGYRSSGTRVTLSNAWILDSSTRDVVWEMTQARESWRNQKITSETYSVALPAGEYEVYYSTYPDYRRRKWNFGDWGWNGDSGMGRIIHKMLDKENLDEVEDAYDRLSVAVEGQGHALTVSKVDEALARALQSAIVSIRQPDNRAYVQRGFKLDRKMKVRLYSVGEGSEEGSYDFAWVINADTRERVWKFDFSESRRAGGAEKNRMVDEVFEAPEGRYVVFFATDGSHTWNQWNAAPPHDPLFWGVTVYAEDPAMAKYASTFDYKEEEIKDVIVSMTRAGDDFYEKRGFTLKIPATLRVYALGEGRDGEMSDYAWIVDAHTRQRVWEMTYGVTEHAGGATKNRVYDGEVKFDKGDYLVFYVTDGSHAHETWNSDPPIDREHWGITVSGSAGFNPSDVAEYKETDDGTVLVRMTEVGNDEHISKDFTLKRETSVYVYALGEGMDGRMYDYGWIEDAKTGRVAWEMTYRGTRHAGGHEKNRVFSDAVVLPAGTYRVFYETDHSHSFARWNSDRPYEPENWGIVVREGDRR